uniref:Maturation n=1 Tax=Leviviridae sp. TaxID=2027243 RepID=A0A514D729_9VIRU|nr:MAG: hypothetical protein H2Bulk35551_000003 [Leviviridae sp.]
MATRSYSVPLQGGSGKLREYYSNYSNVSPKVNGKLTLIANEHQLVHANCTQWTNVKPGVAEVCGGAEQNPRYPFTSDETNQVRSKFIGKLRTGSASLGVTLASWGQSRSMIVDRLRKIDRIFRNVQRRRDRNPRRRRYSSRVLASDFLEGEFGWIPLLQDIHALTSTVCQKAIPPEWVKATSQFPYNQVVKSGSASALLTSTFSGRGRCTMSARVSISNPNLWLANRLGIINPAVVAWDLVPWSFVVNMFVNVNQILSSLTDTVGLTLTNGSTTTSSSVLLEQTYYTRVSASEAYYNFSNVNSKFRGRLLGSPPRPSLRLKLPEVNFELAAIASALVRQRVKGLR